MNASLAQLILSRIQAHGLPWLDKTAGLTRAISFKSKGVPGKSYTWPIACDVSDPQGCDVSTQSELMPDERLTSLLFFEGETFPQRIADRALGIRYTSRLRIVVWMNCSKLGGACNCGDHAARDLIAAIESRVRYSEGPFIGVRHKIIGGAPSTGPAIFSKYTFDEARSQYLHYPFDFFALDIETDFRILPGCEDQLDPDNVNCWQPPPGPPRKWPKDLTCAELTDPVNGLTAEQLGPDCLDCAGTTVCDLCTEIAKESSTAQAIVDCIEEAEKTEAVQALLCDPCPPTTVNGTQSDTPTITVLQGGEQVGTLNPATGVHTVPECDPCPVPECDDLVDAVVVEGAGESELNGLYRFDGYGGPAGIMAAKKYRNANDHIIAASDYDAPDGPFGWTLYDSLLTEYYNGYNLPFNVFPSQGQWIRVNGADPAPTVRQATIADLCPCAEPECEDVTIRTTDGLTTIDTATSGSNYDLPSTVIVSEDAGGMGAYTTPYATEFDGVNITPGLVIQRREIFNDTPTGLGLYVTLADLIDDTVPQVPTRPPDGDAIIYRFGSILASGQTTVYRTGDEGSMLAAGFFTYAPTIGPNSVLQDIVGFGTGGDWTALQNNNSFGNTLRFTDRSGGAAASSGNRFIIDHLTNCEYYVLGTMLTAANWEAAVDAGVAINATLGETGWYLPNDRILDSITNDASANLLNYAPFNIGSGQPFWTSSTTPGNTANAKALSISGGQLPAAAKTINNYVHGIYVRRRP